jgi:hypothetical protein
LGGVAAYLRKDEGCSSGKEGFRREAQEWANSLSNFPLILDQVSCSVGANAGFRVRQVYLICEQLAPFLFRSGIRSVNSVLEFEQFEHTAQEQRWICNEVAGYDEREQILRPQEYRRRLMLDNRRIALQGYSRPLPF